MTKKQASPICLTLKVDSFTTLKATTDPSSVEYIPQFLISLHSAQKPSGDPVPDSL